jgi:hypothetical protein
MLQPLPYAVQAYVPVSIFFPLVYYIMSNTVFLSICVSKLFDMNILPIYYMENQNLDAEPK